MKKIFSFMAVAALIFGLASCSKDNTIDNGMSGNSQSAFQFTLKTSQGSFVTRAIADGDEWTVNDVNIYVFDATSKALIGTNSDFTYSSPTGAAVLTASSDWLSANQGKAINVYFVGNKGANSLDAASHVSLNGFASDEDAIKELLTDAQNVQVDKADKLTTPLLFSAYTTTSVTVPSVGKVTVPVSLKRREARFDIVNPIPTNFVINRIVIRNANIQGYVFGANGGTATMATSSIEEILASDLNAYDADNTSISAFYLYPTVLGYGENTEISIIASVNGGAETAHPVRSTAAIEANKRYKLSLDPATLSFDVIIDDYDEGDEYPIVTIDQLTMSGFSLTGDASFDAANGIINVAGDNNASTVELTVFASTAAGVDITYTDVVGSHTVSTAANTTDATVTYSNIGYKTTIKVDIAAHDGSAAFQTNMVIADKGTPEATAELRILHGAVSSQTVEEIKEALGISDDVLAEWVMNNVGAGGVITPEDIENVTEITIIPEAGLAAIGDSNNMTSLDGIEKFPKMKRLHIRGGEKITSADLSHNPELTYVGLEDCSITYLDISVLPNLDSLTIARTLISKIEFQNSSITHIGIGGCPIMSSNDIDLSGMPNLKDLVFAGGETFIEELDLTHSNLTSLKIYGQNMWNTTQLFDQAFKTINLSGLPNLELLRLEYLDKLETVTGQETLQKLDYARFIYCTKIPSIDFSGLANLNKLTAYYCTAAASINVSNNPKLENADVNRNSAMVDLNITNVPNLKIINMNYSKVTSMDISNYQIATLNIGGVSNITITVWPGFDHLAPINSIPEYTASSSVTWVGY